MIALDSSAIIATILHEPEAPAFEKILVLERSIVGAPTLVETRIVLEGRLSDRAGIFLHRLVTERGITVVPFDPSMAEAAADAFRRYGKGRGHPACLNFGDCMAYAVASVMRLPLLFKGDDFVHTDIVPAHSPAP
jgi:ribonuclease VapC